MGVEMSCVKRAYVYLPKSDSVPEWLHTWHYTWCHLKKKGVCSFFFVIQTHEGETGIQECLPLLNNYQKMDTSTLLIMRLLSMNSEKIANKLIGTSLCRFVTL